MNGEWPSPARRTAVFRDVAAGVLATILCFMSVVFIPVVGVVPGLFSPLPTLLSLYRLGPPAGYAIPGGSVLAGSALLVGLDMASSIPYLAVLILLGVLLGTAMRHGWSAEKTVAFSSAMVCGVAAVIVLALFGEGGSARFAAIEEEMRAAVTATLLQHGMGGTDPKALEDAVRVLLPVMTRLIPGFVVSTALLASWLNILAVKRYCERFLVPFPPWGDWSRWKSPDHLVWGVVVTGFCLLVPNSWVRIVATNVLVALGTVYLFHGLSVVAFYFAKWRFPTVARAIFYGVIFLQQFATLGVMLAGLFDVWFDFRRLDGKNSGGDLEQG